MKRIALMIAIVTITIYLFTCNSCGNAVHTIHFETNAPNVIITDIVVTDEAILTELPEPYRDGYVFDGWYVDPNLQIPYELNEKIRSSFTLYAKWD